MLLPCPSPSVPGSLVQTPGAPWGANIAIFVAPTDVGHIPRYRRYGLRFFELKIPAVTAVGCLGGRRARGTYVRALPSNLFNRKEGQFFSR